MQMQKVPKALSVLRKIAKAKVVLSQGQCTSNCTGCACEGFK